MNSGIKGVVYLYTSPTGKIYIGLTIDETSRRNHHKNSKDETYFHRAIRKYGFDSFKYEVLIEVKSESRSRLKTMLNTLERYYIKKYKANNPEIGYNLAIGGSSIEYTDDRKNKVRKSLIGKSVPLDIRTKISDTLKEGYLTGRIGKPWLKPIIAFKDGKYYKTYNSASDAAKELGILKTSISNILKGRTKQTRNNFLFKYKEE